MKQVVVVGGGFAGLAAARALGREPEVAVTLVDRRNHHLFQPLLYQVATAGLSPAEIAAPIRSLLSRFPHVRVLRSEAQRVDLAARTLHTDSGPLPYDWLVLACGARHAYFGHEEWEAHAPELKSLAGALDIRNRILGAFEAAELEHDPERRRSWLTFVVVGGGPTGVEMAGQIAEVARDALQGDFREIDTKTARVLLVEAGDRILATFPPSLSRRATRALEELGVTPLAGHTVVDVGEDSVAIQNRDGDVEQVGARTAIWAAGVNASPLASQLAGAAGVEVDRAGRVPVRPDLTLAGHSEVLALGDMVSVQAPDGTAVPLPGVAPVAMQQGRYAARAIRTRIEGGAPGAFHYVDKGNLATIGRSKAVADIKGLHVAGFPAWALWLLIHIVYLIGFQNRLLVVLRWTISFVTRGRGARLIVDRSEAGVFPRT